MAAKATKATNKPKTPEPSARMGPAAAALVCVVAWLVPGAGHLWCGRARKGLVFLVILPLMFALGLFLDGRLFPFVLSEPLVGLAAVADLAAGLPYFVAKVLGLGAGTVTSVTYEYGNTFLIVSGLLNSLVILDAFDLALGRRAA